ncbi:MAG: EutN/CcmL family microcompartment protein [Bacilli bacterium]|nr:EutN/CcmL family microcompartment protein [Bacilli bacterium]
MQLAKVIGNLVSTHKNESIVGKKILFVQPLDENLEPFGYEELALDVIGAGVGDIVVIMNEGKSARQVSQSEYKFAPVDLAVAGIVDSIQTRNNYKVIK